MNKKREKEFFRLIILLILLISLCITGCGSISDGEYAASVTLTGGSGRAGIDSPCRVTVTGGKAEADIIWSSPNYDYMIVGGETYYPINTEGNSEFVIPVDLDKDMEIQADTTAMSTPHLIDYTLRISILDDTKEGDAKGTPGSDAESTLDEGDLTANTQTSINTEALKTALNIPGLTYISTDENAYAECFAIHRYEDGYAVISVDDGRNYLIIPDDKTTELKSDNNITIIQKPLRKIYLAASSAMCHFDAVGAVETIALSGTEKEDWYIESAKTAMEQGELQYGGKYSAPDYEKMVMDDIDLAIENTMILHVPKVQEKLEKIGIPVFIDRSSYESQPLGRCEWIKIYGLLTGKEEEADKKFSEQEALITSLKDMELSGKTVAIFSVNSNHQIVTRKKNDYFAKMISMAGGIYLPPVAEDDGKANAQTTISMEAFYDYAREADILIYNATIVDAPESMYALASLSELFADFKAYNTGEIWYTDKSLYQYADKTGTIIDNLYRIISEDKEETEFFHKLK